MQPWIPGLSKDDNPECLSVRSSRLFVVFEMALAIDLVCLLHLLRDIRPDLQAHCLRSVLRSAVAICLENEALVSSPCCFASFPNQGS
jgi:hypothetical protein